MVVCATRNCHFKSERYACRYGTCRRAYDGHGTHRRTGVVDFYRDFDALAVLLGSARRIPRDSFIGVGAGGLLGVGYRREIVANEFGVVSVADLAIPFDNIVRATRNCHFQSEGDTRLGYETCGANYCDRGHGGTCSVDCHREFYAAPVRFRAARRVPRHRLISICAGDLLDVGDGCLVVADEFGIVPVADAAIPFDKVIGTAQHCHFKSEGDTNLGDATCGSDNCNSCHRGTGLRDVYCDFGGHSVGFRAASRIPRHRLISV